MSVNPYGFPGSFDPWSGFNASPPPPASPPASPPGPPPPASPPVSEPVDIVTVTGRRPGGGIGYRPIFWGGGGGAAPPVPPPAPPPSTDGVDTVVVTGQRPGRFDTEAQARDFGIALIQAQPDRNRREYGLFVVKVGDKYDVSELIAGPNGSERLGAFSRDGANGTIKIPENAVGFLHSHPQGLFSESQYRANMYLSERDIGAWALFKEVTGNSQFKMWLIGPDGNTREFDRFDDVPRSAWEPPRPPATDIPRPNRNRVPHVGPDVDWRGPTPPAPSAPPVPDEIPGTVEPNAPLGPPLEAPPEPRSQWQ